MAESIILFLFFLLSFMVTVVKAWPFKNKKKQIVIFYSSRAERCAVANTLIISYVNYLAFRYSGVIFMAFGIALAAIIFFLFIRRYTKKYNIFYSGGEESYKEIPLGTLNEFHIPFSIKNNKIFIENSASYVEFIDYGFVIKNYKAIPEYKTFLERLENNIKSSPFSNKWKSDFLKAADFILLPTVLFAVIGILMVVLLSTLNNPLNQMMFYTKVF